MPRNVICISRTRGADGETVGHRVAEQLGFAYVDEDIVVAASRKAGLDPSTVARIEERAPLIDRLLDALSMEGAATAVAARAASLTGHAHPPIEDDLRTLIRHTIEEVGARGRAVIVAHAASYALKERPDVLRVLVTASPATRAQRLTLLSIDDAAKAIRESDRERDHYLRRFYDVREETPLHYDLVINTDVLDIDHAVAAIVAAGR